MTNSLEQSIQNILFALEQRDSDEITGALLGELVRRVAPELDIRVAAGVPTGSGALTRFIEKYLNSVLQRVRPQGPDWVYAIAKKSAPIRKAVPSIWQEFVRPNSPNLLFLHRAMDGQSPTITVETEFKSELVPVKTATHAELDKIRIDFTHLLNGKLKAINAEALDATSPYAEWSNALKKLGGGHYREWTEYRINQIIELFDLRLEGLNVPVDERKKLCEDLRNAQTLTRGLSGVKNVRPNTFELNQPIQSQRPYLSKLDLRTAVLSAISHLSDAEIREIRIPVGALFDALTLTTDK